MELAEQFEVFKHFIKRFDKSYHSEKRNESYFVPDSHGRKQFTIEVDGQSYSVLALTQESAILQVMKIHGKKMRKGQVAPKQKDLPLTGRQMIDFSNEAIKTKEGEIEL